MFASYRYDVMRQCWSENPDDRPTFTELRERLESMMEREVLYTDVQHFDETEDESDSSPDEEDGADEETTLV